MVAGNRPVMAGHGRGWQEMKTTNTKQILTTALVRQGIADLARLWDVSETEAGKRINGNSGIKVDALVKALDETGLQLVDPAQGIIAVDAKTYEALQVLAKNSLKDSE